MCMGVSTPTSSLLSSSFRESMMEQADQLEAMHEQRMELLTKSIKKVVQSKKRRREEEAEEEDVSAGSEHCHWGL